MSASSTIVVAVDGSKASMTATRWAANAAAKRGDDLRIAASYTMPQFLYSEGMVPPQELFDQLQEETLSQITKARDAARDVAPHIRIGHTVAEGSPIDLLLELSKHVTMIVMGSRGLGGLTGMVMGSVSAAVVSHAHCPVVVVREDSDVNEDTKYGPIVVGVDGSEVSQKAIEYAFTEAEARKCQLIAVHTWMDAQVQASIAGITGAQQEWSVIEEQQTALLTERLKPFVQQHPDVDVTLRVTRDRPVMALAEAAQGAQLLVVGSHGRGGFKGMLLGSTSRALLQNAPCPLMVVRHDSQGHHKKRSR